MSFILVVFVFGRLGLGIPFFMVNSSEVWEACPSISFFFARLGAALGVSSDFFPLVRDFF